MAQLAGERDITGMDIASRERISQQEIEAAMERLRAQLGGTLVEALMTNDLDRAKLNLQVADLAADPRSTVGFLEYLGQQGGGATPISQGLTAGMTPSPVWEYFPQTKGFDPQTQGLLDYLTGLIRGR